MNELGITIFFTDENSVVVNEDGDPQIFFDEDGNEIGIIIGE